MPTFRSECPACGHSGSDQVELNRPCKRCGSSLHTDRYLNALEAEAKPVELTPAEVEPVELPPKEE